MKVIGVITQKGGQGKSFICSLLSKVANTRKSKVLVIDCDYPQHTIYKLRNSESDFLKKNPSSPFAKKVEKYIKRKGYVDIITSDFENFEDNINRVKDKYDYIFIDFTGSLNVKGLTFEIFKLIDTIVVPTRVDADDIRSNFEFCFSFLEPYSEECSFVFYFIFNQVENVKGGDLTKVERYKNFLKNENVNYFDNFILKRKSLSKYMYDNKNGENSTILPIKMDKNLLNLAKELKQKIL